MDLSSSAITAIAVALVTAAVTYFSARQSRLSEERRSGLSVSQQQTALSWQQMQDIVTSLRVTVDDLRADVRQLEGVHDADRQVLRQLQSEANDQRTTADRQREVDLKRIGQLEWQVEKLTQELHTRDRALAERDQRIAELQSAAGKDG